MDEIIKHEPGTERISRFQSLQTGQYWRALQPIPGEGIDEGTVLLIQSIRWVDDAAHTIILRPHPSKIGTDTTLKIPQEDGSVRERWFRYTEHRFLLKDFLAQFEYEPDHQAVRSGEVREVQGRINALQSELLEAQSNPALLARVVEDKLREQQATETPEETDEGAEVVPASPVVPGQSLVSIATGTVADAIGTGITPEAIASLKQAAGREHQIATIKSQWIQGKTGEIAATIKALTPYYEEQAAAALAQTEDVRTYVAKLMEGIESLDLYVGKDVEVTTIREGEPAPSDQPLTFVQKKLMMDEELAVWADIDEWFDFSKEHLFFEALRKHDTLVRQIFPTERCVLVMATTRRYIDYGEKWTNHARNDENRKVFLLVRNGMNIHRVFSPVESHLGSARLFPSRDEQDGIFRGMDGSQIKFEDVAYTDRLAAHERFALHYKRFLLLVCGLDHRLKLFGDFYDGPASLNFVSLDFQEKHCRFLHDDDGSAMLPGEKRTPLNEWIAEKNAYLRSGSRVLCNWFEVMNPDTAPAACKTERGGDRFDRRYRSAERMSVAIAYRDGQSLCVDVAVSGRTYNWEDRSFNCKVNLTKFKNGNWDYTDQPFLCLDAVQPEELHWYIHNRDTRRDHLSYIRFFKQALKFLREELASEQDTRQRLAQALAEGAIATGDEASAIIHQAVIAWRAANRGKPLPRFEHGAAPAAWKSLLDQMYMLAGEGQRQAEDVAAFVSELGYAPLRLVLSGGAKLVIYAAPTLAEQDNRIEPHAWVHRITVERGKTRYAEKSRRWATLPKAAASETTLHQWPQAEDWADKTSVFQSFERKQELFAAATGFAERLKPFCGPMDATTHAREFALWSDLRDDLLSDSKYVRNPDFAVPFGMVYYPRSKELRFLCVGSWKPHAVLYQLAPDEVSRDRIRARYTKPYADKGHAQRSFQSDVDDRYPWALLETTVTLADSRFENYVHGQAGVYVSNADGRKSVEPLLEQWFGNWMQDADKAGARYWIADGTLNDSGELIFDQLLGVHLPDNYAPVAVMEIELRGDTPPPGLTHWFDICPIGTKTEALVEGIAHSGYSSRPHSLLSPEHARDFIQKQAAANGAIARAAAEIANAAPTPHGIERWFIAPKESA